jgi:hypothetical protein
LRREQPHLNPDRLVCIDETWAKTNMTRPRGRAPKGLTAPLVVDGAINGELFLGWVRLHLVPTLRQGDIVVMDNLGADTVAGVREAITAVGARVF